MTVLYVPFLDFIYSLGHHLKVLNLEDLIPDGTTSLVGDCEALH